MPSSRLVNILCIQHACRPRFSVDCNKFVKILSVAALRSAIRDNTGVKLSALSRMPKSFYLPEIRFRYPETSFARKPSGSATTPLVCRHYLKIPPKETWLPCLFPCDKQRLIPTNFLTASMAAIISVSLVNARTCPRTPVFRRFASLLASFRFTPATLPVCSGFFMPTLIVQ